ncbi:TetR family transcriptional regulator [Microbacterium sp. A93]|uniref:TetR family transcriptional regulator n=1 Tax=unclassified Microbacterium TaxID=2609290 RepID=UPI003F430B9A
MSGRSARTAERLQECALQLFTQRGFDDVTVDEIARAAGVSHMTFFRHFRTKEAVLLDDPYDPAIGAAVVAQDVRLPPLERARRGVMTAWDSVPEAASTDIRTRIAIVAGHSGLRARAWQNTQRTEEVIVDALTRGGTSREEAVVAAGACLGALMAALLEWGRSPNDAPLSDRIQSALVMLGQPVSE